MKIAFIFPNSGSGLAFHPGIQILSAMAKQRGHETKLFHIHDKIIPWDNKKIVEKLVQYKPDMIAFTSTEFEFDKIKELAFAIQEEWNLVDAYLLLGGKAAISHKDDELLTLPFNAYCVGEAEKAWPELLDDIKRTDIKGMWFAVDHVIIRNPLGEIVIDLDSIPFMDYDIFDTPKILDERDGWLSVQFTRGCPFACTYCYVTADRKLQFEGDGGYGVKNYLRKFSVEYAMGFLENLCEKFEGHIKFFNMDDELPTMHKKWFIDFCDAYRERIYKKYGIEFVCNSRINIMTEELVKTMSESGCAEVRMGFESGNFRVRSEILHKPITEENMRQVYKWCDKWSLKASSFTMIGIPTEIEQDIQDTIRLTAELKPYIVRLSFCYPFENTPLFDFAVKNDLMDFNRYMKQSGYFEESPLKWDPDYEQTLMAYRFLFPWFVNKQMENIPLDIKEKYMLAILDFMEYDFRKKEVIKMIQDEDKELSDLCGDLEHFAYFPNGFYFVCKNKKYPKIRPIVRKQSNIKEAQEFDVTGQRMRWIGDDKGYFLIRKGDDDMLEVGHCKNDTLGKVDIIVKGKEPAEVYEKLAELDLFSRWEHACYIGKELTKLFISVKTNKTYIQDDPIDDVI